MSTMPRVVSIGAQDFERIISNNCFYVDKTMFIKEWWESQDMVTSIARPRCFGKTLNMSKMECFLECQISGERGPVSESGYLEGRKIPGSAGDLSGD